MTILAISQVLSILVSLVPASGRAPEQTVTYVCSPTRQNNHNYGDGITEGDPPLVIEIDPGNGALRFLRNDGTPFAQIDHVKTTEAAYSFDAGDPRLRLLRSDGTLTYIGGGWPGGWLPTAGYVRGSLNRVSNYAVFSQGVYDYAKGQVVGPVQWFPLLEGPCRTRGTTAPRISVGGVHR